MSTKNMFTKFGTPERVFVNGKESKSDNETIFATVESHKSIIRAMAVTRIDGIVKVYLRTKEVR